MIADWDWSATVVFLGVNEQGLASIVKTAGNQDVHVILRGGSNGPNYSEGHVLAATASILKKQPGRRPAIMIDCSRASHPSRLHEATVAEDRTRRELEQGLPKPAKGCPVYLRAARIWAAGDHGRDD
jgi:phospho-2-dehydro-3-deoxyheptonate aldolase